MGLPANVIPMIPVFLIERRRKVIRVLPKWPAMASGAGR